MSFDLKTIYELLPSIYRIRDLDYAESRSTDGKAPNMPLQAVCASTDGKAPNMPLQALLGVIAEQIAVLEENLAQLYDDQFIETCAEWVIPYIGDLIGYRIPYNTSSQSPRCEVANTIGYRKRKGTALLLEQVVRDVTGWNAHVVEYFQRLALAQHVQSPRLGNCLIDVRDTVALEGLNTQMTPFESLVHTVDVRNIGNGNGRYNLPNIGIFVWRLPAYKLTRSPAVRTFKDDRHRYLFSPPGNNLQLFHRPANQDQAKQLDTSLTVAMPISRSMLTRSLADYYGPDKSIFLTRTDVVDEQETEQDIWPTKLQKLEDVITVSDLSDRMQKDDEGKLVPVLDENGNTLWNNLPEEKVAIDPVLGRIAFPRSKKAPGNVLCTFYYGFSADIGGGEYHRSDSFTPGLANKQQVPGRHFSVQEAIDALQGDGVVEITDSGRNGETLSITAGFNQRIELRAADFHRPLLVLQGGRGVPELTIHGEEESEVTLNGLLISAGLLHVTGNIRRVVLKHCTLVPGLSLNHEGNPQHPSRPSLLVESNNTLVEIDHCIVGGLRVGEGAKVQIMDSIVDATSVEGIAYAGPAATSAKTRVAQFGGPLSVENCTIIGKVSTMSLEASNTIFLAHGIYPLLVERRQEGCVRFSYLSVGAQVPRQYRCVQDSEDGKGQWELHFTSLRYGDPGYCQLNQRTAAQIRQGADDGAEIGALHLLYQPQRETNLRLRLSEYLRFDFETGIFYMT